MVAVSVGDTVALTVSGSVLSFDRATPATLKGSIAVSGLQANEKLVGLDTRPADGLLYALSDQARVYTLNASTGVATFKAALSAAAGDDNPAAHPLALECDRRIRVLRATQPRGGVGGAAVVSRAYATRQAFVEADALRPAELLELGAVDRLLADFLEVTRVVDD